MIGGEQPRVRRSPRAPRGHGLVLAAGALTTLAIAGLLALSVGYGQAVEGEQDPAEPVSQAESGVETEAPSVAGTADGGLRPWRVARSGVLLGLPLIALAAAAAVRRRRPAIAARGAATVVLALWTLLFVASAGVVFLIAATLTAIATGLAVADRPPPGGSM